MFFVESGGNTGIPSPTYEKRGEGSIPALSGFWDFRSQSETGRSDKHPCGRRSSLSGCYEAPICCAAFILRTCGVVLSTLIPQDFSSQGSETSSCGGVPMGAYVASGMVARPEMRLPFDRLLSLLLFSILPLLPYRRLRGRTSLVRLMDEAKA